MVIWPWSRFEDLTDVADGLRALLNEAAIQAAVQVKDAEIAAINLRTAERDLERLSNEYNLLKGDFKALVAQTAGRLQPRVTPLDLDRDPFQEIVSIPTEWLTDDSELPDIRAEELLDSASTDDGSTTRTQAGV